MKRNFPSVGLLQFFLFAFICSAQPALLNAQNIDLGLSTRRTIGSDIFGFNCGTTIRGGSSCLNPYLLNKLPLLKPQVLRFPQGAFASWYNWREGWVYDDPNVPPKYENLDKVPNRLEDYKVLRDSGGAQSTILVVNMITSNIPEQIKMLQHADSIGIPVNYVELGNEFYLDGEEDSTYIMQIFPTPSDYGIAATEWADSIHKYFPNAKVAAQGVFDKNSAPRRKIWNDSVLAHLQGEDAMTFHFYYASADADSLETEAEKLDVNMGDVPDWLYQPYKAWDILLNKSMIKVRPGKEVWVTEFNLSDHERPTHGYWTHGLFQALQTLLLFQDQRITKITPHSMCGTAVYASYFYDTEGFVFGNGDDASFVPPPVQPPTTFWGLTATGNNITMIGNSLANKNYASIINFSPNPQVMAIEKTDTIYYNGLFGFLFNNDTGSDAMILNLTGDPQVINTDVMFPSGGTYQVRFAPPLRLIANPEDVNIFNGTLSQTLTLPPYSSARITSSTIPDLPPAVAIAANGPTTFCAGDSVELDAGAGHLSYVWSNGMTSRKIWARSTGEYSVRAYDHIGGYYGTDTVHVLVNPNPTKPNIKVSGSKEFCTGDSVLLYLGPNFSYTNVTYSWPLTGQDTTQAYITSSGDHYLLITDNETGCYVASDTEKIVVYPLPEPVISTVGPAEACSDSGVTLQVDQVYEDYDWSAGGNLQTKKYTVSGTYWVEVGDSNGCRAKSNAIDITLWEPQFPDITVGGPTTYCIETPTVLSTIPGYTYQWLKGNTVLTAATDQSWSPVSTGQYKVVVTDEHGCSKKNDVGVNITVNSLSAPSITITGGSTICAGQTTQLSLPAGYSSYSWSNGSMASVISVGDAGSYTCTISDTNGCVATTPAKWITVNPLPLPVITPAGPTSFCYDASVTLSAQPGFNQYNWSNGKSGQTATADSGGEITVTVKDSNGCWGTSPAISLTVWDLPVPAISNLGPDVYCIENPSTLTTISGYSYQWKKGANILDNATSQYYQPTVTNLNYKVVITDEHGCSRTSDNYGVTVNSGTPASLSVSGGTTICAGQVSTISATAGYSSYSWSNGQNTSSIQVSTPGNYFVTTTDVNGCTAMSSTKTIVVNPLPAPVINAQGATSFCDGGSVVLDAGAGYNSYAWSNGKTTPTNTINSSGTYWVTVTDGNGCSATAAAVEVTEWIPPTPEISSSTGIFTFCTNDGVSLFTVSGYNYQWLKAGNAIDGATNSIYYPSGSGNYKVTLTDEHGCSKTSALKSVTINTNPVPVISGPDVVCDGSSIVLNCGNFSSYSWSNGSTSPTITVSSADNYSVVVTDANNCQGISAIKNITISALPTPVITAQGTTTFCEGGSVMLDAGAGFNSYNWSNGKFTQTVTINSSGDYSVTVTNAAGCSATSSLATVNVWVLPVPEVVSSSGNFTYCSNSGTYLTTLPGYSYQWRKGNTDIDGATDQNYVPTSNGNYKVVITDEHGCTKTGSNSFVTILSSPAPQISGPSAVCPGSSITLSCGTFDSYYWSNGSQQASINVNSAGSFSVTVGNSNGCMATSPVVDITQGALPVPVVSAQGPTQFCDGGNVVLDAGAGYSSYSWSNNKSTQTNSVNTTGVYQVTVTNASGCLGTSLPVVVTVWTMPDVNVAIVGSTTYCKNDGTYLTTLSGPYNYQWLKGSTVQNGATNQNFAPTSSGTYKVKVTDLQGCNKTSSGLKVTVNALPKASISKTGSANICPGQTKSLSAKTASGQTYAWFLDGLPIPGATSAVYIADIAGTYTCVVTKTSTACSAVSNSITLTSNCKDDHELITAGSHSDQWKIYPNPTNSELHIRVNTDDLADGTYRAEIRSIMGNIIWQEEASFSNHSIETDVYLDNSVAAGMYVVVLHVGDRLYNASLVVTGK